MKALRFEIDGHGHRFGDPFGQSFRRAQRVATARRKGMKGKKVPQCKLCNAVEAKGFVTFLLFFSFFFFALSLFFSFSLFSVCWLLCCCVSWVWLLAIARGFSYLHNYCHCVGTCPCITASWKMTWLAFIGWGCDRTSWGLGVLASKFSEQASNLSLS